MSDCNYRNSTENRKFCCHLVKKENRLEITTEQSLQFPHFAKVEKWLILLRGMCGLMRKTQHSLTFGTAKSVHKYKNRSANETQPFINSYNCDLRWFLCGMMTLNFRCCVFYCFPGFTQNTHLRKSFVTG